MQWRPCFRQTGPLVGSAKCKANLILLVKESVTLEPAIGKQHPEKAHVTLALGAAEANGQGRKVHGAHWWFEDSPHLETKQSI